MSTADKEENKTPPALCWFLDGEREALKITKDIKFLEKCEQINMRIVQTPGSGTAMFGACDTGNQHMGNKRSLRTHEFGLATDDPIPESSKNCFEQFSKLVREKKVSLNQQRKATFMSIVPQLTLTLMKNFSVLGGIQRGWYKTGITSKKSSVDEMQVTHCLMYCFFVCIFFS